MGRITTYGVYNNQRYNSMNHFVFYILLSAIVVITNSNIHGEVSRNALPNVAGPKGASPSAYLITIDDNKAISGLRYQSWKMPFAFGVDSSILQAFEHYASSVLNQDQEAFNDVWDGKVGQMIPYMAQPSFVSGSIHLLFSAQKRPNIPTTLLLIQFDIAGNSSISYYECLEWTEVDGGWKCRSLFY